MRERSTGQHLDAHDGQRFFFDAGAVCLDFGYTGGEGPYEVFEILHEPDDLARWLEASPLAVRFSAPLAPDDLAAAKELREVMRGISWDVAAGRPPDRAALAVVNRCAAAPPLAPRLAPTLDADWVAPVELSQVLSSLAREAIDVFTEPRVQRLKSCAAADCPLVFLDTSRPGTRKWCSMDRCGNRSKVRAHRARHA